MELEDYARKKNKCQQNINPLRKLSLLGGLITDVNSSIEIYQPVIQIIFIYSNNGTATTV